MIYDRPKADKYGIWTVFVIVSERKWCQRKGGKKRKSEKNGKSSGKVA